MTNEQLKTFLDKDFWSLFSQKLKTEENFISVRDLLSVYGLMLSSNSDHQTCQSARQMILTRLRNSNAEHAHLDALTAALKLRQQLATSRSSNQQLDSELVDELLKFVNKSSLGLMKSPSLLHTPEAVQKSFLTAALQDSDERLLKTLAPLIKQFRGVFLSQNAKKSNPSTAIQSEHFEKLNDPQKRKQLLDLITSDKKSSSSDDLSLSFECPL